MMQCPAIFIDSLKADFPPSLQVEALLAMKTELPDGHALKGKPSKKDKKAKKADKAAEPAAAPKVNPSFTQQLLFILMIISDGFRCLGR